MLDLCVGNQKVCELGIEAMFRKSDAEEKVLPLSARLRIAGVWQLFLEVRFRSVVRGEGNPTYMNCWLTHPPKVCQSAAENDSDTIPHTLARNHCKKSESFPRRRNEFAGTRVVAFSPSAWVGQSQ